VRGRDDDHDKRCRFGGSENDVTGDAMEFSFQKCVDCGSWAMTLTATVGENRYHFPMTPQMCLEITTYLIDAVAGNMEGEDDGSG
jgi:hypothetical protein